MKAVDDEKGFITSENIKKLKLIKVRLKINLIYQNYLQILIEETMIPTKPKKQYKNLNCFNYSSQPRPSLDISSYKFVVRSMEISPEGKGGVLFVQTPEGALVVKCTNDTPTDLFYNQLALGLGLSVPQMTTLSCYTPQFHALVFGIEKFCQNDEVLYARIKNKLDQPFYEVLQYVPSITIAHTGKKKFKYYMLEDYKLYTMGMGLAFDMIINNSDRLRLVSRSSGNIKNMMIEVGEFNTPEKLMFGRDRESLEVPLKNFVFIDHDGHLIDKNQRNAAANIEKIMEKIIDFQLKMVMYLRNEGQEPEHFLKLKEQIKFYTEYEYNEEEIKKISSGIIYCTVNFIRAFENGHIQKLYKSLWKQTDSKQQQIAYWNQHWNKELERIHLSFCEVYYVKVSAIYTTYPQLINAIYDEVDQVMQKHQRNKGKQWPSKQKQEEEEPEKEEINEERKSQHENKEEDHEEDEIKDEQRKRRWREKLDVFKGKNYSD